MRTIYADIQIRTKNKDSGSALVIALIVLAILGVLGFAALEVAELNIFMAANDRDTKETFFLADSGANIARELTKSNLDNGITEIFDNDATTWVDNSTFDQAQYSYYTNSTKGMYVRSGLLRLEYEGQSINYSDYSSNPGSKNPTPTFLIRSYAEGKRNSKSEIDVGWKDRPMNP